MKTKVYNLKGKSIGEIDLPEDLFNAPWRPEVVREALHVQTSSRRKTVAHAKTRSEVRGGGKKPWRQKGTGRARHGSIRSPIWKGGGVTHGPTKDKNFSLKINRKAKKLAIASLLSKKVKDTDLKVIDSFDGIESKTKALDTTLKQFLERPVNAKNLSTLIVPAKGSRSIFRASANIPKVKALNFSSLNVEDLMKYKNIFLDKGVLEEIQ